MGMKAREWIRRLGEMGRQQWIVLILLGLLLMTVAMPVSGKKSSSQENIWETASREEEEGQDGKTTMERKLEKLLSQVEGVGKAEVVLMMGEESSQAFSVSHGEIVTGAVISAQGADDFTVVQNIKEAVMALFQLEAHKIKVMKMIKET